jgi:putative spermidine/putrescine transport system substrate-binding protein
VGKEHMMQGRNALVRKELDRQEFLRLSGAVLVGAGFLGIGGCGGNPATGGNSVVFVGFGGSYQQAQTRAWFEPFSEETGIEVLQESPTDYAKLRAMVENQQVTWDVVETGEEFGLGSSTQWLEPLDYSVIDSENIIRDLESKYRVPLMFYGNVLAYNTEQVEGTPQNWADFFDLEKFPGKRCLWQFPTETLEIASLGAGTPPEDLYPLDIELALDELDTIKDQIVWWESGAQSQQLLSDGEVGLASIWTGRADTAIDAGKPVKIQWNQHIAAADYLVVPKGAPHKEQAMELIAYIVSAKNNHRLASYIANAPVNTESIPKVDPKDAAQLPTAHLEQGVPLNGQWWAENRERATEMFNQWLLG